MCILLNLRSSADSIPSALTIFKPAYLDRGMRTQEPVDDSCVFAQKSQQQVLRLYVRRTELTGLVARKEDDASCFLRVAFEHISPHAKFSGKVSGRAIVGSEQIVCAVLSCNCKAQSEARVLT